MCDDGLTGTMLHIPLHANVVFVAQRRRRLLRKTHQAAGPRRNTDDIEALPGPTACLTRFFNYQIWDLNEGWLKHRRCRIPCRSELKASLLRAWETSARRT